MSTQQTVLLVGGTGRTGKRVLEQLLDRGLCVRVIVRSAARLPAAAAGHPNLTVVEAQLLALGDAELQNQIRGCDAVISCLGHVISFKGVFGPPRDLVTRAVANLCRGIEALRPAGPVKFILMSSVSVNRPGGLDTRRGKIERVMLRALCALVPPARDNQTATDFLAGVIGPDNPSVHWVVVRPDALLEGDVSAYLLHEGLVSSLAKPDKTTMANIAHFMGELVTVPQTWDTWRGGLPVIIDAPPPAA